MPVTTGITVANLVLYLYVAMAHTRSFYAIVQGYVPNNSGSFRPWFAIG